MEGLVNAFNDIVKFMEELQGGGKFSLQQANLALGLIVAMKNGIEGLTAGTKDTASKEELEATKLRLMEFNLELNSLKDKFAKSKAAEEQLETVVTALRTRFQLTDDDVKKLVQ